MKKMKMINFLLKVTYKLILFSIFNRNKSNKAIFIKKNLRKMKLNN